MNPLLFLISSLIFYCGILKLYVCPARLSKQHIYHRRKCLNSNIAKEVEQNHLNGHSQRKPAWVTAEVLRLKAHMGKAGCRSVAMTFNRLHSNSSIGKTFVAETIKHNQYQLTRIKRTIRNNPPKTTAINAVWGMDLSYYVTSDTQDHPPIAILGIIDHGSRLVIKLTTLINKRSWTLIGHLCLAIGQYGKPKAIRTDNEVIFKSFVFRTLLKLTGIKHQQTQVCAPWQNGRIERLFGTLKPLLKQLIIPSSIALQEALCEFAIFYNHVRPHQHMAGLTPAEAWARITPTDLKRKQKRQPELVQMACWWVITCAGDGK